MFFNLTFWAQVFIYCLAVFSFFVKTGGTQKIMNTFMEAWLMNIRAIVILKLMMDNFY